MDEGLDMLGARVPPQAASGASTLQGRRPGLAFAHLNLRRNPFGELPTGERVRLAAVDVRDWADLLRRPGVALQFVGDHGRGKTTRLLALHAALDGGRHAYTKVLPEGRASFRRSPLHFVDSFDLLSPRQRRRAQRVSRSLALTTHRDLGDELRGTGHHVHTVLVRGLDAPRLRDIVDLRIEAARRGPGALPRIGDEQLHALIRRFGDDVRAIEAHLYSIFQRLEGVGDVPV